MSMIKTIGEETKEQPQEKLRKTKAELELQKWAAKKTTESLNFIITEIQKFSQAVDGAYDSILFTDLKGNTTYINDSFVKAFGYSKQEIDIVNISKLAKNPADAKNIFAAVIKKGFWKGEIISITKNGQNFPTILSVTTIRDQKGLAIGTMGIVRDITYEKEVDRAKTEFVSLASHELRTPLTGINWLTEMLGKGDLGKLNAKQKETIEVIAHSAKQMTELIGTLLNVSRLELGTFSINPKPVALNKITDEILQELRPTIIKKEIIIKNDYPDKLPLMNADPILLKIVCQNLLSDAVNYAFPKTIVTVKINKDNNNLLFTVTNQGIGIAKEEQSKIFTKLFRGSNAQLFVTGGTGLGLYISKLIIDASGGKIWFDSELNKQTNFYISLPLKGMATRSGGKVLETSDNKI